MELKNMDKTNVPHNEVPLERCASFLGTSYRASGNLDILIKRLTDCTLCVRRIIGKTASNLTKCDTLLASTKIVDRPESI